MNRTPGTRLVIPVALLLMAAAVGPTVAYVYYSSFNVSPPEPQGVPSPTPASSATFTAGPAATPSAPASPAVTPTWTSAPAATAGAAPAKSATATMTATPLPGPSATPTRMPAPAGMILIPAGYFLMGSADGLPNESPEHPVLLDAFYIDRYEVSNADYRRCVEAGGCPKPRLASSFTRAGYRDDPAYGRHPVIGVSWDEAVTYCTWAGRRLPTEAEWEYAASGPNNYTWPWGNEFDANRLAAAAPDTQPVDSYPEGLSPFGVFNMAGNVTEWVVDVYVATFYAESPPHDPVSTGETNLRIYRGGSFGSLDRSAYTTSHRYARSRRMQDVDVGFRCAMDAPVPGASTRLVREFCQVYAAYKPGAPCP